ncbi:MAG: rRNA methyltransferase [Bacteroidia bacterium]
MNFPTAFVEQIKNNLGDEADAFLNALTMQDESVSVRINKNKISFPTQLTSVPWCDTGFYLPQRPSFTLDPLFHSGAYYVQEASSMFLEQIILQLELDKRNCRVLDLCAAPGGKSTHLISLINEESLLVSNEVIRSRTTVLAENMSKWGKPNYVVTANDAKNFSALENYFDAIICDAPCSGEGLFRKDTDAINEWSEESIMHCAQRQKRIVADVWNALKPGGYFIYSTCTFNKKENEDNVKWICETLGAECVRIKLNSEWGIVESSGTLIVGEDANHGQQNSETQVVGEDAHHGQRPLVGVPANQQYGYHFYPHKVKGEGFFTAVLQKKNDESTVHPSIKEKSKQKKNAATISAKEIGNFNQLISQPEIFLFVIENNQTNIFPQQFLNDLELLKKHLKIIEFGTSIGELKGKDIIPHHSLANSLFLNENLFEKINLNLVDALRYLKGETNFNLSCDNGWVLVYYQHPSTQKNYPLGFAKKIGNRINNHFPKGRMIRMQIDYEKIKASDEEAFVYPFKK